MELYEVYIFVLQTKLKTNLFTSNERNISINKIIIVRVTQIHVNKLSSQSANPTLPTSVSQNELL